MKSLLTGIALLGALLSAAVGAAAQTAKVPPSQAHLIRSFKLDTRGPVYAGQTLHATLKGVPGGEARFALDDHYVRMREKQEGVYRATYTVTPQDRDRHARVTAWLFLPDGRVQSRPEGEVALAGDLAATPATASAYAYPPSSAARRYAVASAYVPPDTVFTSTPPNYDGLDTTPLAAAPADYAMPPTYGYPSYGMMGAPTFDSFMSVPPGASATTLEVGDDGVSLGYFESSPYYAPYAAYSPYAPYPYGPFASYSPYAPYPACAYAPYPYYAPYRRSGFFLSANDGGVSVGLLADNFAIGVGPDAFSLAFFSQPPLFAASPAFVAAVAPVFIQPVEFVVVPAPILVPQTTFVVAPRTVFLTDQAVAVPLVASSFGSFCNARFLQTDPGCRRAFIERSRRWSPSSDFTPVAFTAGQGMSFAPPIVAAASTPLAIVGRPHDRGLHRGWVQGRHLGWDRDRGNSATALAALGTRGRGAPVMWMDPNSSTGAPRHRVAGVRNEAPRLTTAAPMGAGRRPPSFERRGTAFVPPTVHRSRPENVSSPRPPRIRPGATQTMRPHGRPAFVPSAPRHEYRAPRPAFVPSAPRHEYRAPSRPPFIPSAPRREYRAPSRPVISPPSPRHESRGRPAFIPSLPRFDYHAPPSRPAYVPQPRPAYVPQSRPAYVPQPRPAFVPPPRPAYVPQARPAYVPPPSRPAFVPQPRVEYHPAPAPAARPAPAPAAAPPAPHPGGDRGRHHHD